MKKGFTLIEMMLVVAIIGVLLVLLIPRVTRSMDKARERATAKNLKSIKLALDQYGEEPDGSFAYPTTKEQAKEILEKAFTDGVVPRAVLRIGAGVVTSNECYVTDDVSNIPVFGGGGWVLITTGSYTGNVYINSTKNNLEGNPYTTYSCW
ncbi:type II secretion system GspH family protein [bacterium]|nr:type II secretion system GspH family protein [bacterium]MBU2461879.1 type II secretion system GspH family protein [bacterium]